MRPARTGLLAAAALAVAVVLSACGTGPPADSYEGIAPRESRPTADDRPSSSVPGLRLDLAWEGFDKPLHLSHAGDGSGRVFVVEKGGRILQVVPSGDGRQVYLDLTDVVSTTSEQGLLSVAFSPEFASDKALYVDYTDRDGSSVVSRFRERNGIVDRSTEEILLAVEQPYANHNGGQLAFGPDGYLYIGLGDGGGAGDPQRNGQDPATLLGTILRIDVSNGGPYSVPPDNPFAQGGGATEVWAFGLRNPWRFSFDPLSGDLWIADVGQNRWEEIDREPAGASGGANYGWRAYEGSHLFATDDPVPKSPAMPVFEYGRDQGASVTGGFVYRGSAIAGLSGWYIFGDYVSGRIWAADTSTEFEPVEIFDTDLAISSFGTDEEGELYVVDHSRGGVYKLVPVEEAD